MNYKYKIVLLAFIVNGVIFFLLPYIKYLQDKKLAELFNTQNNNPIAREFKVTPPEDKKKKLKIKKNQSSQKKKVSNERFQLNLGVNQGTGIGIASDNDKNIIYQEGDVDSLPEKISGNDPRVPDFFLQSSLPGRVEALVVIDEKGKVVKVSTLKEEPPDYQLKNSVANAVWGWRFKPATLKNIPVKIQVIIPFVF